MSDPGSSSHGRQDVGRWALLLGSVAAISALHYATPPEHAVLHGIYQRAYYAPVIVAAYWFGVRGGVIAAVLSSVAYAPHIHNAWSHNQPYTVSQYAELAVFVSLGVAVGLIASHERRLSNQYREAAESLERANAELRESSVQLRRAERLSVLGQIAAGLAHEIRNPLAGVKGALEIVTSRAAKGTPDAEFSNIAMKELQRIEGLVQEFLDYARPQPPRLQEGDLAEVVRRVASLLGTEAERAGVSITLEDGEPADTLRFDPEQLAQVLVNIVLNAIQASPHGAAVVLRHGPRAGGYAIEVLDRGSGIAPEERARVFEPFFTTKERGTGLGLAISQRIVAAHGGEIQLEPRDDRGTVARILLPRRASAASPGSPA
jgi:two-component system, NtrC family, sensor histidine kinase HydH